MYFKKAMGAGAVVIGTGMVIQGVMSTDFILIGSGVLITITGVAYAFSKK
jgi:hypothetical protein